MKKILAISGLIAFLISIIVGEFADRGITEYFHSRYEATSSDFSVMMQAFISGFIYRPLIACACGTIIMLVTCLTIKLKGGKVRFIEGLATMIVVALASAIISITWTYYEIVIGGFWP